MAIIVDGRYKLVVLGTRALNNRMAVVVRISAAPSAVSVIQVYVQTSAAADEEIEEFYSVLEGILASLLRSDIKLALGNFNAKVGKTDNSDGLLWSSWWP